MPLIVLGIIAVGGGLLLVHYLSAGGRTRRSPYESRSASNPAGYYKTSEDGKVIYLFNGKKDGGQDGSPDDDDGPGDGGPEGGDGNKAGEDG